MMVKTNPVVQKWSRSRQRTQIRLIPSLIYPTMWLLKMSGQLSLVFRPDLVPMPRSAGDQSFPWTMNLTSLRNQFTKGNGPICATVLKKLYSCQIHQILKFQGFLHPRDLFHQSPVHGGSSHGQVPSSSVPGMSDTKLTQRIFWRKRRKSNNLQSH
ncbi:hypothetical protein C8J56DRAFT_991074 [Mycena floridula]|nr:hypothetical protein C8J56DRAFT_991074 [Mycena floridula]